MSLSDRQRDELHKSMLSYFKSQGLTSSFKVLSKELAVEDGAYSEDKKYVGLLEKKWMSVIRLQKKIMDLEQAVGDLQASIPTHFAQVNGKVDLTSWVPRAPARHTLAGHRQPITSVAFHPVFSIVATSSEDSTIKLWDWETGEFERTLKSHTKAITDVDFSPSIQFGGQPMTGANPGRPVLLASCSNDLTIKLWDSEDDYRCTKTLYGHDHVLSSVKFLPTSGDHLASVSRDRSIRIWEVTTGFCIKTIENAHGDWIRCLTPSFDGLSVLTAGSDRTAKLHVLATGDCKVELTGHEHVVECVAVAPSAAHATLCAMAGTRPSLTTSFAATGSRDKSIKLWNLENGVCVATLSGHDNWLRALVFHPDGKFLLSAGDDKCLKVWDLEQAGRCCRTIDDAHGHFVSCLRWGLGASQVAAQGQHKSADPLAKASESTQQDLGRGRYVLASGGVDQVVKIWLP